MENAGMFIVIAIVLVAFGALAYYQWKKEKERTQALSALASSLGLRFERKDHSLPSRFHSLLSFNKGHSAYCYNVITGDYREQSISAFDYRYTVTTYTTDSKGHRRRRDTHYHSSSVILEVSASFPELFIRSEGLLDKMAGAVGFDDIDFESAEFSRKYYVKSKERRFAYDVIHARLIEYFLERGGWQVYFKGTYIQFYNPGRFKLETFQSVMDSAVDVFAMIPGFVFDNMKGRVY